MQRQLVTTVALSISLLVAGAAVAGGPQSHAVQLRVGGFVPAGGGDLWSDNTEIFTLESTDFADFTWGLGFATALSNNVEFGAGVDWYRSEVTSAYRDYVDGYGYDILHVTSLEKMPLTVDLRFLPAGRYRRLPDGGKALRPVFYLGIGGGLNLWQYEEVGDFVDSYSFEVVPGYYRDSGVAWEAHAMTGLELPLNPGFALFFEGRYAWSKAELDGDFAGFGEIDLGGPSVYLGGSFRF